MKYEKPVLKVFLADEALGANCTGGSTANPVCSYGGNVDDTCYGGSVANSCADGSDAWGMCPYGNGYGGFACGYGEGAVGTCCSGPYATDCNYGYSG